MILMILYSVPGGGGQKKLAVVSPAAEGHTTQCLKAAANGGKITLYFGPKQGEVEVTRLEKNAAEFSKMPKASCEIRHNIFYLCMQKHATLVKGKWVNTDL